MRKATNTGKLDIYYLSFADDDGFKGVCVVEATDSINAVQVAHRLGINPGGQVMITLIPRSVYDKAPKRLPFNQLMDRETLIELGGPVKSLREMRRGGYIELERAVTGNSSMVCPDCNRTDPHEH